MIQDLRRRFPARAALLGIVASLAAGLVVLADESSAFFGQATAWTAVAASGPVHARAATDDRDEWSRVRRGDELAPLSDVRTGRKGKATLVLDAHILLVRPESELVLPLLEEPSDDSQVYQDSGRVTYEVDGSRLDRFEVVTPFLIAGVKGTVFTVTVRPDGAVVSVEEGVVEVRSRLNEDRVELVAGQEARLRAGDSRQEIEVGNVDPVVSDHLLRELRMARQMANLVSALRPRQDADESLATDFVLEWSSEMWFADQRDRWRERTAASREARSGDTLASEETLPDLSDLRKLALEESVTTWIESRTTSTDSTRRD